MTVVGVFGAGGFIGQSVISALNASGIETVPLKAPRLRAATWNVGSLIRTLDRLPEIDFLVEQLSSVDVVINAAGVPNPAATSSDTEHLGANALLPGAIAAAALRARVSRLVHVSSAAVQGRRWLLDETAHMTPFSPYSRAKAIGEVMASRAAARGLPTVVHRATSVHGPTREATRRLVRLARSPLSSVAGRGDRPTPQVLVGNVGAALAFLATVPDPPRITLQPSEGHTTRSLLCLLGSGRRPHQLPHPVVSTILAVGASLEYACPGATLVARRLEMLWLGQDQVSGWLRASGFDPPHRRDSWAWLAADVAHGDRHEPDRPIRHETSRMSRTKEGTDVGSGE